MDDIFVAQLMTSDPRTVPPETSVEAAADLMLDDAIGSVLVVDGDDRLHGVLTRTDFVRLVAEHDTTPTPVARHMTSDVVTTTPRTPIREAADTMVEHGFHHLPVVDDDGTLVGIVTTTDLAAYLSNVRMPSPS